MLIRHSKIRASRILQLGWSNALPLGRWVRHTLAPIPTTCAQGDSAPRSGHETSWWTTTISSAVVVSLPYGFTLSDSVQVRSGLPYPAYSLDDINNDAVANQVAFNDRPVVTPASGKAFLLPRYPARQPNFFQTDFRVEKNLK